MERNALLEPSEVKLGDHIRAMDYNLESKRPIVLGTVHQIHSNGFTLAQHSGKLVYVDNTVRHYYLIEREEPEMPVNWETEESRARVNQKTIEVQVNDHTFELGEDQHLRVWIEDGRTHIELVFVE